MISQTLAKRVATLIFHRLCPCTAIWGASASGGELQVGAAMRVITPNPLLPVSGGMGAPKPNPRKERRHHGSCRRLSKAATSPWLSSLWT